jgi:hypothetical protein
VLVKELIVKDRRVKKVIGGTRSHSLIWNLLGETLKL